MTVTLKEFKEKYPNAFGERLVSFGCGEGWRSIVEKVVKEVSEDENTIILQVKEKLLYY